MEDTRQNDHAHGEPVGISPDEPLALFLWRYKGAFRGVLCISRAHPMATRAFVYNDGGERPDRVVAGFLKVAREGRDGILGVKRPVRTELMLDSDEMEMGYGNMFTQ